MKFGLSLYEFRRLMIYKFMLNKLYEVKINNEKSGSHKICYGFCAVAPYICTNYIGARPQHPLCYNRKLELLHELLEYKPVVSEDVEYWFDRYDTQKRIDILESIISKMSSEMNLCNKIHLYIRTYVIKKQFYKKTILI